MTKAEVASVVWVVMPCFNEGAALRAAIWTAPPDTQSGLLRACAERSARNGESDCIEPRNGGGPAPLSKAQQMLWVYEQMNPGTDAYHIPMARRVRGRLDAATLEHALLSVVERHEALRTKFVEFEGEPKQVIVDAPQVQLEQHDLRALPS